MSQSTSLIPVCPAFAARQQLTDAPGLPFADHLPAPLVHATAQRLGYSFRERIFTPAITLWTFLSQVLDPDHSCRQAVARLLAFRTARGLRPCSPDNGAYCRARARLPEELLKEMTRSTGRQLLEQAPQTWLWKGRPVKVVDGTGLSMPDSQENQKAYPKSKKLPPGGRLPDPAPGRHFRPGRRRRPGGGAGGLPGQGQRRAVALPPTRRVAGTRRCAAG